MIILPRNITVNKNKKTQNRLEASFPTAHAQLNQHQPLVARASSVQTNSLSSASCCSCTYSPLSSTSVLGLRCPRCAGWVSSREASQPVSKVVDV